MNVPIDIPKINELNAKVVARILSFSGNQLADIFAQPFIMKGCPNAQIV
jgi:hypothetical protein